MSKFLTFRGALVALVLIFFGFGSYVGYLAALVDIDEQIFFERVSAVTDKERLETQLARAESILDARRRAYLRRSLEFIREKEAELLGQDITVPVLVTGGDVEVAEEQLSKLQESYQFSNEERDDLLALKEERSDLQFFEDEVDTIDQLLAREFPEEDLAVLFSGDRQRRRISDALIRLLQLLDKQKELSDNRQIAKTQYSFWERNPKNAPSSIDITVYNKGVGVNELNPVQVTQISTALAIMPSGFDARLQRLYVVYGDPEMRRGMSGVGVVFMKGEELDFFRVLVHEFGHIYDLHREVDKGDKSPFYDGSYRLFQSDPSVAYYNYSWAGNSLRVAELPSFASSYGTSDPFEDFAEAYALYVLQNRTFNTWRNEDPVLARKYDFLNAAFNGRTFNSSEQYLTRPYDVTMLKVDYDELLDTSG
jgi:hypothetical protein